MPRPVFEMNSRIVGEELTDLRPDDAPAYAVSPRFRYERKTPVKLTRLNQMLAERRYGFKYEQKYITFHELNLTYFIYSKLRNFIYLFS